MLVALHDEAGLRSTADRIAAMGRRCLQYDADISVEALSCEIIADVAGCLGAVHILVNNAGGDQPGGILELTAEDWRRTLALNLDSAFCWTRAAVPFLIPTGQGLVVVTSWMSAKNGGGGLPFSVSKPVYAAAKSGLLGLARGLAVELGPSQVTVNAVCPGPSTRRPSKASWTARLG